MRVMSLDLGKVRTGVAISDVSGILACPLCVVEETDTEKLLLRVVELINKYKITDVVVGLPKNMDSTEGESARKVREFKEDLQKIIKINVELIDERWSTKSAQHYLNIGTTKAKRKKSVIDKVAATIILQQYLDTKNRSGGDGQEEGC